VSSRSLVIVPVDGSAQTERIVQFAVSIAKPRGADVHAVQVIPREGTLWLAPESETKLRARLRALRPAAEQQGVPVRIVTLRGTPERVVPAYAQLNGASLIVVGRHYGSSRLWRKAAVARRLSRSSPVPVLVVPSRRDAVAEVSVKRIVAAVDFTVASAAALRTAVDLSRRHGARLTILHAMEAPRHLVWSGGEARHLVHGLRFESKALAERLKRKAIAFGSADAEPVVVTGDADLGIVGTADETAADLIVMGVAPRTWIDEFVAGSTLGAVLRRANAPVLVIPVISGAHEWIEATHQEGRVSTLSSGDVAVPRAA
jgi:nucleotide-binding universal stress UspA family protein